MNEKKTDIAQMPIILVIDDDKRLRDLLFRYLNQQSCLIMTAENAAEAEGMLKRFQFNLAVIDVMMPGEDGISFMRRIKPDYPDLPFLMLTARAETEFRIEGLEAGVDDYLPKPFEPKELWLRIQAILRRTFITADPDIPDRIGPYHFDRDRRLLRADSGNEVLLTESENTLLSYLYEYAGQTLDRYKLAEDLGLDAAERTIDVQITRLRKKIESDPKTPRYLQTVRGKGYVLRT